MHCRDANKKISCVEENGFSKGSGVVQIAQHLKQSGADKEFPGHVLFANVKCSKIEKKASLLNLPQNWSATVISPAEISSQIEGDDGRQCLFHQR